MRFPFLVAFLLLLLLDLVLCTASSGSATKPSSPPHGKQVAHKPGSSGHTAQSSGHGTAAHPTTHAQHTQRLPEHPSHQIDLTHASHQTHQSTHGQTSKMVSLADLNPAFHGKHPAQGHPVTHPQPTPRLPEHPSHKIDLTHSARPAHQSPQGQTTRLVSLAALHPALHGKSPTQSHTASHSVQGHPPQHSPQPSHGHPAQHVNPSKSPQAHAVHLAASSSKSVKPGHPTTGVSKATDLHALPRLGRPLGRPKGAKDTFKRIRKPVPKDPNKPYASRTKKQKDATSQTQRVQPRPQGGSGAVGPWWNRAGGKPQSERGTSPRYEASRRYRERKKLLQQKEKHSDEHPSGHSHFPKGPGPGSPGAGSQAVSKRAETMDEPEVLLCPRTAGSGSKSPSSSHSGGKDHTTSSSTGKQPVHEHQFKEILGGHARPASSTSASLAHSVHPTHSRPPGQGHPAPHHSTALTLAPPMQHASHSSHLASGSGSRPLRLGHLAAEVQPGMGRTSAREVPTRPRGRPTGSKDSRQRVRAKSEKKAKATTGADGSERRKPGRPKLDPTHKRVQWWNKPGGHPPIVHGTSPRLEYDRQHAEKKKLRKLQMQGLHPDEHPSGHQHHFKGPGPGSPGAGSHAVSKRRRALDLPADNDEVALSRRGSSSGSKSPSPSRATEQSPVTSSHGAKRPLHEYQFKEILGEHAHQETSKHVSPAPSTHLSLALPGQRAHHLHQAQQTHQHEHQVIHPHPLHAHLAAVPQPAKGADTAQRPRGRPKGVKDTYKRVRPTREAMKAANRQPPTTGGPRAPYGRGSRYEASKRYRERKKLRMQGKHLDEHPSVSQHPSKGPGPGSPGAGSQTVSKRLLSLDLNTGDSEAALARRGSNSGSRSSSPSHPKEKSPATSTHGAKRPLHESQSEEVHGDQAHQKTSKPASPEHLTQLTLAHPTQHANFIPRIEGAQQHPALHAHPGQASRSGARHGERLATVKLGHLATGLPSAKLGELAFPPRGRPKGSKDTFQRTRSKQSKVQIAERTHPNIDTKSSPAQRAGTSSSSQPATRWWNLAGGRPRAASGSGPRYEADRRYRERKKLRIQLKHLDEVPSGPQHPSKKPDPGSPGAGSHAVSKRSRASVEGDSEVALSRRGSNSGSRSPSPSHAKGKSPATSSHGAKRPLHGLQFKEDHSHEKSSRPTSPGHLTHLTLGHPTQHAKYMPRIQEAHQQLAHSTSESGSRHGERLSTVKLSTAKLGHVAADHPPAEVPEIARLGRGRPKGAKDTFPRTRTTKKNPSSAKSETKWWNRVGGQPVAGPGTSPRYEARRRYRENKKLRMQEKHLDEHPSGHHDPSKGPGPGSPGAGSHAVSKRRRALVESDSEAALSRRGSNSGSKSSSPSHSGERGPKTSTLTSKRPVHEHQFKGILGDHVHSKTSRSPSPAHSTHPPHAHQLTQVHPAPHHSTALTLAPPGHQASPLTHHGASDSGPRRSRGRPKGSKDSYERGRSKASAETMAKKKPRVLVNMRPAGSSPRYETDKRRRERQKLRMKESHPEEHASGNQHPPRGPGSGSPGADSHAVGQKRRALAAKTDQRGVRLSRRGSNSGSKSPSPSHSGESGPKTSTSTGKRPVHEHQFKEILGDHVHLTSSRSASSAAHLTHPAHSAPHQSTALTLAPPGHHANPLTLHGASGSGPHSGRLGHPPAEVQHGVGTAHSDPSRRQGRPKGSKDRQPRSRATQNKSSAKLAKTTTGPQTKSAASSAAHPAHSHPPTAHQLAQLANIVDRPRGRPKGAKDSYQRDRSEKWAVEMAKKRPAAWAPTRAAYGTSPRYEAERRYRENKKLRMKLKLLDEHPSGHNHPPRGPDPGSPGAGSHAVSKRRRALVEGVSEVKLSRRGSNSGSRSPSPSRGKGKSPATSSHGAKRPLHEHQFKEILGDHAHQKNSKPASPGHLTQLTLGHPTQHANYNPRIQEEHQLSAHSASGSGSRHGEKFPTLKLGHLAAELRSGKHPHLAGPGHGGRPKGAKDTFQRTRSKKYDEHGVYKIPPAKKPAQRTVNKQPPARPAAQAGTTSSAKPEAKWWNRVGGRPLAAPGTSPRYEASRQYRERKKMRMQEKHLDEHPSGSHHPSKGPGPGSPGAGGQAVSKRRRALRPEMDGHEWSLFRRGSSPVSGSPSPSHSREKSPTETSPRGKRPVHEYHFKGIMDGHAHQEISKRPASPAHSTHSGPSTRLTLGPTAHAHPGSGSGKHIGATSEILGNLAAGSNPGQIPEKRRPGRPKGSKDSIQRASRLQETRQAAKEKPSAPPRRRVHKPPRAKPEATPSGNRWWQKVGGQPWAASGAGPRYGDKRKLGEMQKVKMAGQRPDEHPSGHDQQHKGPDPGSPGAGSHAVSKRLLTAQEF